MALLRQKTVKLQQGFKGMLRIELQIMFDQGINLTRLHQRSVLAIEIVPDKHSQLGIPLFESAQDPRVTAPTV